MSAGGLRRALRLLAHDARRIGGALRELWRNDWRRDPLDVCLGSLRAEAEVARVGEPNRYRARLMNPEARPGSARLVFDLRSWAEPGQASEHLGWIEAEVPLSGAPLRELLLRFDWCARCSLEVDGAPAREVSFHRLRPPVAPGLWRLIAVVRDPASGADWHSLEIAQTVAGAAPCAS
jgi:hypothetical protein